MKLNKIMMMAVGVGILASSAANAKSFERAYNDISEKSLHQHIKTISSDEFEGRLPTSKGEKLVLDYLTKQFKKAGWQPGNNGSFLQPVELSEITASPEMSLSVAGNGQAAEFKYERDMVLGTSRVSEFEQIKDSEIVFVGYGINAPEYKWNDYEGLDVKGKTVVMLVNDPGYASQIPSLFTGSAMTYYGRWTYKYEEASRQGAAAAIIVHETAPASYPWSVVTNGWTGPQYVLFDKDGNKDRVQIEGWLTLDATRDLFKQAGLDFTTYKNKAMQGPINKPLGLTASATVKSSIKNSTSHNFVATLPGSKRPTEQILLTGHWDHIGTSEETEGDTIYNGAHDNATGISGIIEIAKALASLDQRPERSITVVATTAEEQGLLGSKYYAENPIYALADTVGVLNIDSMNILGPVKDLEVRGLGKSELEKYLKTAALKQKRNLVKESNPAAGSYYRSDHFNFAKVGVPALYAGGGSEPLNSDVAAYRKKILPKMRACYHQTCDEYNPEWDLNGAVDDAKVHFDIIYQLANSQDWPQWSATSEFQRQQPVNKQ